MWPSLSTSLLALSALIPLTTAVQPVIIKNNEFISTATGKRFVIRGVAYQPGGASGYDPKSGVDVLSDGKKCLRDAALLQKLKVNTIRVYNINPDLDHSACMSIFYTVGIYVLLDVNSPLENESINRHNPEASYNSKYLMRVFKVAEGFRGYPNLLGFIAGNEVVNDELSARLSPPYVMAVIRDLKAYLKKRKSRNIPVGYAANDDSYRKGMHSFLTCGENKENKADFYGINSYQWCGDATFQTSGYDKLNEAFTNSSVPVFFSEYGCNAVRPRTFSEIPVVYGPKMLPNFSGGIVYEYTEEANNYGIVQVAEDNSVRLLPDYDKLKQRFDSLDVKALEKPLNRKDLKAPPCTYRTASPFDIPHGGLPDGGEVIENLQKTGVSIPKKSRLQVPNNFASPYKAYDSSGKEIQKLQIKQVQDTTYALPPQTPFYDSRNPATKNAPKNPVVEDKANEGVDGQGKSDEMVESDGTDGIEKKAETSGAAGSALPNLRVGSVYNIASVAAWGTAFWLMFKAF